MIPPPPPSHTSSSRIVIIITKGYNSDPCPSSHAAVPVIKINYSQLVLMDCGSVLASPLSYHFINQNSAIMMIGVLKQKPTEWPRTFSILVPRISQFPAPPLTLLCPNDKGKYFRKQGLAENKVRLVILCPPRAIPLEPTHHHHPQPHHQNA